jgi:hypothetical protein
MGVKKGLANYIIYHNIINLYVYKGLGCTVFYILLYYISKVQSIVC